MSRVGAGAPGNFTSGGSGGTSSSFGATFPSTGTAIGVKSGANMTNLTADGSNNLNVNINASSATVPVSGTFFQATQPVSGTVTANAGTGTFTVQGVAGNGSPVSGNPVLVGGFDGTNARDISVDTSGNIQANVKQINGVAPSMGNGVSGTGVQRVTIASDSTGQVALASGSNTIGSLTANQSVNVAQINGVTPLMGNGVTGTGSQRVTLSSDNTGVGNWGHGATAASVPSGATYKGLQGITALPTAVSNGQLVGASGDKFGRQVVLPATIRDLIGTQTTTISASTSETTVVTAGGAGIFNDLLLLVVSNTSGTAARVDFRDTTGGSVLFSVYVPAGDVRGFSLGGVVIPQTGTNTNWTAQSSASVTDLRVYAVFAKNK